MQYPGWRRNGVFAGIVAVSFLAVYPATAPARPAVPQAHQSSPAPAPGVPFDRFSDSFLKTLGADGAGPSLDAVLEQGYVAVRLGLFDVWHPRHALREKDRAKTFETVAAAVLDLQETWIDWVAEGDGKKSALSDLAGLQKWVRSWRAGKFRAGRDDETGRPDLLDLLDAKEDVRNASHRFADFMIRGGFLEQGLDEEEPLFVVLSPDRGDFLGFGSFMGTLNETNRRILWRNGLAMWTSFVRDRVHVLAMEHPSTWPGRGDITRGIDMNAREKSGLQQHIVQHLTEYMLYHYYGDRMPEELLKGLAMNMVIALYKENNVRAGGGTKGRRTEAYSRFVAGGNANGGRLAARNADIHWRHSKGRDYFVAELRDAQKRGAREALRSFGRKRDKRAYFALLPDDGGGEVHLARTPFLMEPQAVEAVPENYGDEWLEFRRAYRSAFTFWLMDKAESRRDSSDPVELLRRLLKAAGVPPEGGSRLPFDQLVQEIYGASLTGQDGETESLEWRFLDWLSRMR